MSSRHRASSSAPLSTKILLTLGLLFVAAGFGLAGWQSLKSHEAATVSEPATHSVRQYLPSIDTVALYGAVFVIAIVVSAFVLIRTRRRHPDY